MTVERVDKASKTISEDRAAADRKVGEAGEKAREKVLATSDDAVLDDIARAILELRERRRVEP